MSRRSGLGRGLAALIPPAGEARSTEPAGPSSDERDERGGHDGPDERDVPDEPDTVAGTATRAGGAAAPVASPSRAADGTGTDDGRRPGSGGQEPHGGGVRVLELAPDSIVPNPRQPREVFDPDELEGLATSLADVGVLQPLVVRPLDDGRYELVAGERRLRAARLAGLDTVPVLVRRTEDADLLKEALVENIQRVQLNPLEEAAAYQQLLDEFEVTQDELARRLGRSRPAISNTIRLLQLPAAVQRRVAAGVLSAGHARALLTLEDPEQQRRVADRIVAEGLSVRATEELVRLRALDEPRPRRRRGGVEVPGLLDLQEDLSDALRARVRISMGAKRGRLTVEFTSVDDLERIVGVVADGLAAGGVHVDASTRPGGPVRPADTAPGDRGVTGGPASPAAGPAPWGDDREQPAEPDR